MKESNFVQKEPCPACGSKDNLARYDDGHAHCFGCSHYEPPSDRESKTERKKVTGLLPLGDFKDLPKRGLNADDCKKWGVSVSKMGGEPVHVFNYRDPATHQVVAQKARPKDKDGTRFIGDTANAGLFGMHLWRDGGKMVIVTEGEYDAVSVSKLQEHKWPVVSVPTGAKGAKKALKKNLEWLEKFDSVILMFDSDEPGREAAVECAEVFKPGKCKIASLPLKDANEMLLAKRGKELISAIWDAKPYRPDGIVNGNELYDLCTREDRTFGLIYPWTKLNELTAGFRLGEVVTLTAGSGVGKSAVLSEIAYDLGVNHKENVGLLKLEEPLRRAALGLVGINVNKPVHIIRPGQEKPDPKLIKKGFDATLGTGRFFLYDHFGSTESENIINRLRFLARGCDCKWLFVDHLSIIISGQEDGDERRLIDNIMTDLKTLAVECNVCIFLVSHLKRPNGEGHEEGAQTSLAQLRGSHAIAQLSDFVIGMERDLQDEKRANITTLRVLKNRYTGETGIAGWLEYNRETGRLKELQEDPFFEEDKDDAADGEFGNP